MSAFELFLILSSVCGFTILWGLFVVIPCTIHDSTLLKLGRTRDEVLQRFNSDDEVVVSLDEFIGTYLTIPIRMGAPIVFTMIAYAIKIKQQGRYKEYANRTPLWANDATSELQPYVDHVQRLVMRDLLLGNAAWIIGMPCWLLVRYALGTTTPQHSWLKLLRHRITAGLIILEDGVDHVDEIAGHPRVPLALV